MYLEMWLVSDFKYQKGNLKMFMSTKKFGPITTTHRNWKAAYNTNRDSVKCSWIHGYSRYVELTFLGDLDERTWVYDFGDCKPIKQAIEDTWDHKVLVNSDDPELEFLYEMEKRGLLVLSVMDITKGHSAGIEGSAKWVHDIALPIVQEKTQGRVHIAKVQVWEHEFNSAIYVPLTESRFS